MEETALSCKFSATGSLRGEYQVVKRVCGGMLIRNPALAICSSGQTLVWLQLPRLHCYMLSLHTVLGFRCLWNRFPKVGMTSDGFATCSHQSCQLNLVVMLSSGWEADLCQNISLSSSCLALLRYRNSGDGHLRAHFLGSGRWWALCVIPRTIFSLRICKFGEGLSLALCPETQS